ncbi:MAG: HDOD domain-containing protein [Desulfovibrio sp.]|jgi:putative nucleotidyltransferase with HDIG domain|nr:HDOD domain-containing protein [Desulfovibrio sp.]
MKRTILFVDDEPNILMGLRRMLRPMRDKWEMLFAGSGPEALEIMSRQHVDAVVSDMRMPGMDGPQLLRRIMKEHPDTIRFALSGYSDQEMVGQSIAPTHQYLTKPCDEKQLVNALEMAMEARELVPNKAVLDKIARVEHLPVLPEIYNRITAELAKGEPSPKEIGDIVARDVGMSANILKLVNSAYFGLPRHISAPQQAVIVLGVNVIRSVILSLHVFSSFQNVGRVSFSLPMLWGHSMRAGAMARTISQHEHLPKEEADHAYIAALLHDVGKLLMEAHCTEECERVYSIVRAENRRVAEVEAELLGLTHAEVGAYLLGLWGLPAQVVHAVARHHDASPPVGTPAGTTAGLDVADIVHFANLLDHEIFVFNEHYAKAVPSPERLDAIGGPGRYADWRKAVLTMGLGSEDK